MAFAYFEKKNQLAKENETSYKRSITKQNGDFLMDLIADGVMSCLGDGKTTTIH